MTARYVSILRRNIAENDSNIGSNVKKEHEENNSNVCANIKQKHDRN